MPSERELFSRWKEALARRYGDSFESRFVQEAHENLVSAYQAFIASDCVDPHFISEICSSDLNKSAQRLGEALLYEKLSHLGLDSTGNLIGPDFRVEIKGQPIWLELVKPSAGEDICINKLLNANDALSPCSKQAIELSQRSLLRITSAISEKLTKFERYLRDGVVRPRDSLIIVINDALLCPDLSFYGVSHGADNGVGGGA